MSELGERLYIQYGPDAMTRSQLTRTSDSLVRAAGGEPVNPAEFHLTLLHYGKVDGMFNPLQRQVPGLTKETYLAELLAFQDKAVAAAPSELDVRIVHFQLPTPKRSETGTLIGLLAPQPELDVAHRNILKYLSEFLLNCGISDGETFIRQSPNLRDVMGFKPHVALARKVSRLPKLHPPQQMLHFDLLDPWYDLAHERHAANTQD